MKVCHAHFILLIFSLVMQAGSLSAQTCDSKYVVNDYNGATFIHFNKAGFTAANEVILAGDMVDYNEAGYLARFSKNGIPLWSNYYIINFYDFVLDIYFSKIRFLDFALTADGGIIVAGQTERYFGIQYGLLAKINQYGVVEWTKTCFTINGRGGLSFTNVFITSAGDIITYMSADNGPSLFYPVYSYNRVICYSANGTFKWGTSLESGLFDAGGNGVTFKRGMTELANKNIVVGDVVYVSDKTTPSFRMHDGRMHFFSLDYKTGKLLWESDYTYPSPGNAVNYIPPIEAVSELPTGQLAFYTSLYLPTSADPAGVINKPVTVITDNRGKVEKLTAFYVPGKNCKLTDVVTGTGGNSDCLFDVDGLPVIAKVNNGDNITSIHGYTSAFPANCFAAGNRGYGIALSNNNSSHYKLLLTDADGQADCVQAPATLLTEDVLPATPASNRVTTFEKIYTPADWRYYFTDYQYPLVKKGEYPLQQTKECEQTLDCCKDFVDSVHINQIKLCEGSSYTFPGNQVVKDSGVYSVTYKTARGCDSILFYQVSVDKNIAALSLGNDTCLTDQHTIQLRATAGFGTYNWMGVTSNENTYPVRTTGKYWVRVSNVCGTKADSVEVFDQCDFPIYMPTAFTPNNDGRNDWYGVPLQNKNRLIHLRIYNRWGQMVFETNSVYKQWDGKLKGLPQDTGVFIYTLEMEGLSGKRVTQNGRLVLIK